MKLLVILLRKTEILSALSIRLVKITGKSKEAIHPKHLLKKKDVWFKNYVKKSDIFLDLGCGVGFDSIYASKKAKKVVAIDIDKRSLKIASSNIKKRKIKNIKIIEHDLNKKLPLKNNSFSKILCSDVLEHLEKRTYALGEIKRVLKKGGQILLVVDNPETSWKKIQKKHALFYYADLDHKYEYPIKEIQKILKKTGFTILDTSPVTFDTPFKGFIDLVGGISLSAYKKLGAWKQNMLKKHPTETTGYKLIAQLK